jgi:hypothetical protein
MYVKMSTIITMFVPVPPANAEALIEERAQGYRDDPHTLVDATNGNPNASLSLSYDYVQDDQVPDIAAFGN